MGKENDIMLNFIYLFFMILNFFDIFILFKENDENNFYLFSKNCQINQMVDQQPPNLNILFYNTDSYFVSSKIIILFENSQEIGKNIIILFENSQANFG